MWLNMSNSDPNLGFPAIYNRSCVHVGRTVYSSVVIRSPPKHVVLPFCFYSHHSLQPSLLRAESQQVLSYVTLT